MVTPVSPAPSTPETWVAVLITLARQLTAAGYESASAHLYEAAAEFAEGR